MLLILLSSSRFCMAKVSLHRKEFQKLQEFIALTLLELTIEHFFKLRTVSVTFVDVHL